MAYATYRVRNGPQTLPGSLSIRFPDDLESCSLIQQNKIIFSARHPPVRVNIPPPAGTHLHLKNFLGEDHILFPEEIFDRLKIIILPLDRGDLCLLRFKLVTHEDGSVLETQTLSGPNPLPTDAYTLAGLPSMCFK